MKKYLIALVALLVVATGCGNTKKLTCTLEEDGSKEVMVMTYEKDELVKMEATSTIHSETEVSQEDVELYEMFSCGLLGDAEYMECSVTAKGKDIEIKLSMDLSKMTDAELEEMGYTKEGSDYETMKKDAEADGYTCK